MDCGDEFMKSVNPLHIIALLFVLLIFLLMQLSAEKVELSDAQDSYKETLLLTTKLKDFNKIYADKKGVRKSISTVLKQHSLKSANITQNIGQSSVTISSQSMDRTALNSLMSKVLNGSYNVASFNIKKLSETKASFTMEIKW